MKRFLAMLLAVLMIVSIMPVTAFAAGSDDKVVNTLLSTAENTSLANGTPCIVTTSSDNGRGVTVAFTSGGGETAVGREITVSTTQIDGYTFVGWFEKADSYDGTPLSTSIRYTFTVTGDTALVAVYKLNGQGHALLRVSGTKFQISEEGSTPQYGYYEQYVDIGKTVTLKYLGEEDAFHYWKNGEDKIMWYGEEYTFTFMRETTLLAQSGGSADENSALVVFATDLNQVLSATTISADTNPDAIEFPPVVFRNERTFIGWDHTAEEIITEIKAGNKYIVVMPKFASDGKYTVTIQYNGDVVKTEEKDSSTDVAYLAMEEYNGNKFSYWTLNGAIESYDTNVSFWLSKDSTINAVYEGTKTSQVITRPYPAVYQTGAVHINSVHAATSDYRVTDAGFVRINANKLGGDSDEARTEADSILNISPDNPHKNDLTIDQASHEKLSNNGEFFLDLTTKSGPFTVYLKTFVSYQLLDENGIPTGEVSTLYSDMMVVTYPEHPEPVDDYVAKIGDTKYMTFTAAAEAANEGDVIELLADITVPYVLAAGKSIHVKLDGKKLIVAAPEGYTVASTVTDGITTYSLKEGNDFEEYIALLKDIAPLHKTDSRADVTSAVTGMSKLRGVENVDGKLMLTTGREYMIEDPKAATSDYANWNIDFEVSFSDDVKANDVTILGKEDDDAWGQLCSVPAMEVGSTLRLAANYGRVSNPSAKTVTYADACAIADYLGGAVYTGKNELTMTVKLYAYETELKNGVYTETGAKHIIDAKQFTFGPMSFEEYIDELGKEGDLTIQNIPSDSEKANINPVKEDENPWISYEGVAHITADDVKGMKGAYVEPDNDIILLDGVEYWIEDPDCEDSAYADWNFDFVVSFDKDVDSFASYKAGTGDTVILVGNYYPYGWIPIAIPEGGVKANVEVPLLATAGVNCNYKELNRDVKDFMCGALYTGRDGLTMTIKFVAYGYDESGAEKTYVIDTKTYTFNKDIDKHFEVLKTAGNASIELIPANSEKANINPVKEDINPYKDKEGVAHITAEDVKGMKGAYVDANDNIILLNGVEYTINDPDYETSRYKDWNMDFIVSFDKDVASFDDYKEGTGETVVLVGNYAPYGWIPIAIPEGGVKANVEVPLLATAGVNCNYKELNRDVKDFMCGALYTGRDGLTMTIKFVAYGYDESGAEKTYVIDTKTYTFNKDIDEHFEELKEDGNASIELIPANSEKANINPVKEDINPYKDKEGVAHITAEDVKGMKGAYVDANDNIILLNGVEYTINDPDYATSPYKDWNVDFIVSFDKDVASFDDYKEGTGNTVVLVGNYAPYGWIPIAIPEGGVKANVEVPLLATAGVNCNYKELNRDVKDFMCGALYTGRDELTMTIKFVAYGYDESGASKTYVIDTKTYTFESTKVAQIGDVKYETFDAAVTAAQTGETVELLCAQDLGDVTIQKAIKLDLGGFENHVDSMALSGNVTVKNGELTADSTSTGVETGDGRSIFAITETGKFEDVEFTLTGVTGVVAQFRNIGNLTFDSCTITASDCAGSLLFNNGTVPQITVKDSTITVSDLTGGFSQSWSENFTGSELDEDLVVTAPCGITFDHSTVSATSLKGMPFNQQTINVQNGSVVTINSSVLTNADRAIFQSVVNVSGTGSKLTIDGINNHVGINCSTVNVTGGAELAVKNVGSSNCLVECDLTVDGGKVTLDRADTGIGPADKLVLKNNADVVVKNITDVAINSCKIEMSTGAKLTVTDSEGDALNACDLTISDAELYIDEIGEIGIKNGTATIGSSAKVVIDTCGSASIQTDGTLTVAEGADVVCNGKIISEAFNKKINPQVGNVEIRSGKYVGVETKSNSFGNEGKATVYGGLFVEDPGAFAAPGYKSAALTEGDEGYADGYRYTVVPVTYVAKIGTKGYETFAEAVTAANGTQTIELLADIGDYNMSVGQTIIIKANGKTINPIVPAGNYEVETSVNGDVTTYTVAPPIEFVRNLPAQVTSVGTVNDLTVGELFKLTEESGTPTDNVRVEVVSDTPAKMALKSGAKSGAKGATEGNWTEQTVSLAGKSGNVTVNLYYGDSTEPAASIKLNVIDGATNVKTADQIPASGDYVLLSDITVPESTENFKLNASVYGNSFKLDVSNAAKVELTGANLSSVTIEGATKVSVSGECVIPEGTLPEATEVEVGPNASIKEDPADETPYVAPALNWAALGESGNADTKTVTISEGSSFDAAALNPVGTNIVTTNDSTVDTSVPGSYTVNYTVTETVEGRTYVTKYAVTVTVTEIPKFTTVFENTDKQLYRIGNANTVTLGQLFGVDTEEAEISDVSVKVEAVEDNSTVKGTVENSNLAEGSTAKCVYTKNADNWTSSTLKFSGEGPVKVTIAAEGIKSFTLNLEIVNGQNVTTATSATSKNIILLNDVSTSSLTVSGGYTLYGNGFKVTDTRTSPTAENNQSGYVTINNGTVDNVQFIGYEPKQQNIYNNGHTDIAPAVKVGASGASIYNCYISGGRYALQADSSDIVMKNTVLDGGAVGNAYFVGGNITLEDCVTTTSTRGGMKGLGICIPSVSGVNLNLKGTFEQHNWIKSSDVPSAVNILVGSLYTDSSYAEFVASSGGTKYLNMGIFFLDISGGDIEKEDAQKAIHDMTGNSYGYIEKGAAGMSGCCYTAKATMFSEAMLADPEFTANNYATVPAVSFDHTVNYKANTGLTEDYCVENNGMVNIQVVKNADHSAFEWDPYIMTIGTKYGNSLSYTVKMNGREYKQGEKISFSADGDYTVEYIYTDPYNFDKDAQKSSKEYTQTLKIHVTTLTDYHPQFSYVGVWEADAKQVIANDLVYVMPDISSTATGQFGSTTVDGKTIYYPIVEVYANSGNTAFYAPAFSAINIKDLNKDTGAAKYTYNSSSSKWPHNGSSSGGYSVVNKQPDDTSAYYGYIVNTVGTCPWHSSSVYANGGNSNASTGSSSSYGGLYFYTKGLSSARGETTQLVKFWYRGDDGIVYYYYIQYHFPASKTYTVMVNCNVGGTVDHARIAGLAANTALSVDGNNLLAGGNVIATVTPNSDEYAVQWGTVPSKLTAHTTVNVDFVKACKVTIECGEGGSVDKQTISVTSGTKLTVDGNKLMNGKTTLATATPNTNYVAEWSNVPGTAIADDVTIKLTFKPPVTVMINCGEGGSVSTDSFQTMYNSTLTVDGNNLKVGNSIVATATPDTNYVTQWNITSGTAIVSDITVNLSFKPPVTVTINGGEGGSVDNTSIPVMYNSKLTVDGNDLKVGSTTIATATPDEGFVTEWGTIPTNALTADTEISVEFVTPVTITITAGNNGSVSPTSVKVAPGKKLTSSGANLSYDGVVIATATASSGYDVGSWSDVPSNAITADTSVSISFNQQSSGGMCFTADTLITMADGTQKTIDQVSSSDRVLSWNFYTGDYEETNVVAVTNHGAGTYNQIKLGFSNGSSVNVLETHDFFCCEKNAFVEINVSNYESYIGYTFVTLDAKGNLGTEELVSAELSEVYTDAYSIFTANNVNAVAEGMLTLSPSARFLVPFEVGEGMKFDEVQMNADIEQYGLLSYEEFLGIFGSDAISENVYYALGAQYMKVAISKGIATMNDIIEYASILERDSINLEGIVMLVNANEVEDNTESKDCINENEADLPAEDEPGTVIKEEPAGEKPTVVYEAPALNWTALDSVEGVTYDADAMTVSFNEGTEFDAEVLIPERGTTVVTGPVGTEPGTYKLTYTITEGEYVITYVVIVTAIEVNPMSAAMDTVIPDEEPTGEPDAKINEETAVSD